MKFHEIALHEISQMDFRSSIGGPCDEVFGLALGAGDQLFGTYLYTAAAQRPDRGGL